MVSNESSRRDIYLDFIRMTMGIKIQTEQVRCENYNRANLIFKCAEYTDDFNDKKGDIIKVDAVCGF